MLELLDGSDWGSEATCWWKHWSTLRERRSQWLWTLQRVTNLLRAAKAECAGDRPVRRRLDTRENHERGELELVMNTA